MRHVLCGVLVLGLLATTSVPAMAQGAPTTRMRNPALAIVGLVTAGVGAFQFAPVGQDYRIGPYDYCVTSPYTVDYGKCQVSSGRRPLGFILLGLGGVMTAYGLSHVTVSPTLSPTVKGATATVRW